MAAIPPLSYCPARLSCSYRTGRLCASPLPALLSQNRSALPACSCTPVPCQSMTSSTDARRACLPPEAISTHLLQADVICSLRMSACPLPPCCCTLLSLSMTAMTEARGLPSGLRRSTGAPPRLPGAGTSHSRTMSLIPGILTVSADIPPTQNVSKACSASRMCDRRTSIRRDRRVRL